MTAMQSQQIGKATRWLAENTGGQCEYVRDMWVCQQGWAPLKARGGTTYGTTFVTDESPWDIGRKLATHEKYHRDQQWNRYGLLFVPMYFNAELIDSWIGGGCNRYEAAGEIASDGGGGYSC